MPSPRILIVRLSAIGDVIQTMPVACALRERFPDAFLAWAVEQRGAELLRGHESLDELIPIPRGWMKSPRTVWRLRRRLRRLRFDTAIDVQSLTKSAFLARLSGARRRIGFGRPGGRELSRWLNNERVDPKAVHMIDRYLELLGPLGIAAPTVRFQVPESEADRRAAETAVRETGVENGFALLNAGAGWPSKLWPADRYAAVAVHLGNRWNLPSLVVTPASWANPAEAERAKRIVAGAQGFARPAPALSLTGLAALARRARLFLGSDTGPLHLASAVGTPCVGLYGPWPGEVHGPYGPGHVILQPMRFDGPTRARRAAPAIYMESITTEMACEACDRIMTKQNRTNTP